MCFYLGNTLGVGWHWNEHAAVLTVAVPTWVAFAVAALTLVAALLMTKPEKNPARKSNKIVFPTINGNSGSRSDLD